MCIFRINNFFNFNLTIPSILDPEKISLLIKYRNLQNEMDIKRKEFFRKKWNHYKIIEKYILFKKNIYDSITDYHNDEKCS